MGVNNPETAKDRVPKHPFSRLARPLQHQRTLFNWGDTNRQSTKERGSFEGCDAAKPWRWTAQALFAWTSLRTHDEPRRSGKCGYIAAGVLRAALTCPLRAALTCLIRAPRACAVLDCWRRGIARQRLHVRCLVPFQLFHFSRWKWFISCDVY